MKKISVILFVLAMLFSVSAVFAQDHKYIGAKKCSMCHKSKKSGEQYKIWQGRLHSKAYATLATDAAKKIAEDKGIADPQKADECLSCHTTGHGKGKDAFAASFKIEEGVGCEACHGPGSVYKKMSLMKDEKKFLANGGIVPDEKLCISCHNEKSPTYKKFVYADRIKQVQHPVPVKK